jgi:hypothetical protein
MKELSESRVYIEASSVDAAPKTLGRLQTLKTKDQARSKFGPAPGSTGETRNKGKRKEARFYKEI